MVRSSSTTQQVLEELGLSQRVVQAGTSHLLNPDGTFNVARTGLPLLQRLQIYQGLLSISWRSFTLLLILGYLAANVTFATVYFLCGPDAIQGGSATDSIGRFGEAFLFSVHTVTTLGYGNLTANGWLANTVVTLEAFFGLGSFAIVAGLTFARFARPAASMRFSQVAIMESQGDDRAFRFRIVNAGHNELIDVEVRVLLAITSTTGEARTRQFRELPLERSRVAFFPVDWVLMHPITAESPLYDATPDSLARGHAEFMVLVSAIDEATCHPVHARTSYHADGIAWDVRFSDMVTRTAAGQLSVDLGKLSDVEELGFRRPRETRWVF